MDFALCRFGDGPFFYQPRKIFFYPFETSVQKLRSYFAHQGRKSGGGADLSDSRAHQPTPHDSHSFRSERFFSIPLRPLSRSSGVTSRTKVENPAAALT